MSFTASFRVVVTYFKGVFERVPLILKSRLGPGGRHSEILSFVSVKEELQDVDGCEVFRNRKIKDDGSTFTRRGRSSVTVRLIKKKKSTLFTM